jgi:hypothetical protein
MDGSCRAHPALARYIVAWCRIRQSAIDKTARDLRDLLLDSRAAQPTTQG